MDGPSACELWSCERVDHPRLPLAVVTDGAGALVQVAFGDAGQALRRHAARNGATLTSRRGGASAAAQQLAEYLAGARTSFSLALRPLGTPFQRAAWAALQSIPYGETRTYAQQARQLGRGAAARAVGQANAKNPLPIVIPCHRVIGSSGALTGFGGGLSVKRWLLGHEAAQASLGFALA